MQEAYVRRESKNRVKGMKKRTFSKDRGKVKKKKPMFDGSVEKS